MVAALAAATLLPAAANSPTPSDRAPTRTDLEELRQGINDLRGHLPSQSHTMADVAYHFSNLWFAGQAKNWPLAQFLVNERKSNLRWAVRVRPVRRLSTGADFRLGDLLTSIEQSSLKAVDDRGRAKDELGFTSAYKTMLGSCHACHLAAEKPYLRLHVPERPAESMLEFDPAKPGGPMQ